MSTARPPDLDTRFRSFMRSHVGSECIDDLPLSPAQLAAKRADYFLAKRAVVVEVKSAVEDMREKIQAVLAPHQKQTDWPVFYGRADIGPFLDRHPHGEAIRQEMYDAAITALTESFESANRQIRSTKSTFSLPASTGLLIYLNDQVEAVAPHIAAHRISQLFKKRTPTGTPRYLDIDAVVVLSETHFIPHPSGPAAPTICLTQGPHDPASNLGRACDDVVRGWSRYTGRPFVNAEYDTFEALARSTQSRAVLDELVRFPAPRHEVWVREYPFRRSYKNLSRADLLTEGAEACARLGASALKGSSSKLSARDAGPYLKRFTWFLEELKLRGIGIEEWMHEERPRIQANISSLSGQAPDPRPGGGSDHK